MTTGQEDPAAAGRGQFRASRADREQVIETLKSAFVEDRLTKDELDARVAQALAALTYADLAALTADLPADRAHLPATAAPAPAARAGASPVRRRPIASATVKSVGCLLVGAAAIWIGFPLDGPPTTVFFFLVLAAVITALGIMGNGVAVAAEQRQSRRKLPPRPRSTRRALNAESSAQGAVAPARTHTDQACAELRNGRLARLVTAGTRFGLA